MWVGGGEIQLERLTSKRKGIAYVSKKSSKNLREGKLGKGRE